MNLLDLGILALLVLITLRGYYRGLFQELAVLAGVVGGILIAAHVHLLLAARLKPWITNPDYARWAAFALVLVLVYWSIRLLAYFLQRILYHLYLDVFDRLLGGFFALVKGALLLGFALMLVGLVMPRETHLLKESRTAPYLMHFSRQALGLLPPDFKQRLHEYLQQWQKPKKRREAAASAQNCVRPWPARMKL
ncbi:MAG: CvpA family protein [Thermodesulfobacteriota bacterium]